MSEEIICSILRDGANLVIKLATPPLPKRLIDFLLKTPELSATEHESRMRLFGALQGQSSDYFFIGEINGNIVGSVWYCTPAKCKEIAYMGEVFTEKEHRQKGIATNLLDVMIDFFRKNGGRVIYVTNLCPRAPHQIYRKMGFQPYGYGQQSYGGIVRLTVDEAPRDFDRDYYRYDPNVSIRSVDWGDLPHFIALLNYPHPWTVRAYNFGLIGYAVFDELGRAFMSFMKTLKRGNICLVLEDSSHRAVGTAYSSSLQVAAQSHVRTADFLVHPNYFEEAPQLLEMLEDKLSDAKIEKLQVYASARDNSKIEILRFCEFEKEATLQSQLKIVNEKTDLEVYCKLLKK